MQLQAIQIGAAPPWLLSHFFDVACLFVLIVSLSLIFFCRGKKNKIRKEKVCSIGLAKYSHKWESSINGINAHYAIFWLRSQHFVKKVTEREKLSMHKWYLKWSIVTWAGHNQPTWMSEWNKRNKSLLFLCVFGFTKP